MTTKEFNNIVKMIIDYCEDVLISKTEEYVLDNDDRLKAFRREWLETDKPENEKKILWGQMAKHISSIYDYCLEDNPKFDVEHYDKWYEKIADSINYLIILFAIVYERAADYTDKKLEDIE